MSAPTLTLSPRSLAPAAVISVAWFAAALGAGALGAFHTTGGAPPVAIGLAAGAPPLAAIAFAAGSPRFRAWAMSLDLRFLTLLQAWRAGGLAFLGLAIPAGVGDLTVGLTAPLVAAFVVGRSDRLYLAWTALGIADLITAVTLGILYSSSPIGVLRGDIGTDLMASLPMSIIPTFGVPITLVIHILALTNLRGRRAGHDH